MKKSWQRGILLGVSLVFLLASGVALAASLRLSAEKECIECWPGEREPTEEQYLGHFSYTGWDSNYPLCNGVTIDGEVWFEECFDSPPGQGPITFTNWYPCEWNGYADAGLTGRDVTASPNGPEDPLGEWTQYMWQENDIVDRTEVSFMVLEDCSEYLFVPEPGTFLLLGSGLVGLAGYATLRLRSGQALRWRTRE